MQNNRSICRTGASTVMAATRDKPGHRLRAAIHAFAAIRTASHGWWAFADHDGERTVAGTR
jgi:hypothetical protein